MLNVGLQVNAPLRVFSDSNPYLIAMWQAAMEGWVPPDAISEKTYKELQKGAGEPHERGFAGFAGSFGGKWFGSYARCARGEDFIGENKRALLKAVGKLKMPVSAGVTGYAGTMMSFGGKWFAGLTRDREDRKYSTEAKHLLTDAAEKIKAGSSVVFVCCDYTTAISTVNADLIYCDPPYQNTTQEYYERNFDSAKFWKFVRKLPEERRVFVSEYQTHKGFEEVLTIRTKTDMHTKGGKSERLEHLYGRIGHSRIVPTNPSIRDLFGKGKRC